MCFESVAVSFKNCNELHLRQRLRPTVYKPQISEIQIAPVKPELDAAIVGQKAQLTESADIHAAGFGRLAELPTPEGSISPVGPIVVVAYGDIFFTLGCSLSAILVLQTTAAEKEAGLLVAYYVVIRRLNLVLRRLRRCPSGTGAPVYPGGAIRSIYRYLSHLS